MSAQVQNEQCTRGRSPSARGGRAHDTPSVGFGGVDDLRVWLKGIDGRTDADTNGAMVAIVIDDELRASDIEVQAWTRCSGAPIGVRSLPNRA